MSAASPDRSRSIPPEAWPPLARLADAASRPVQRFFQVEAASGILLLAAAAVALVWANSAWGDSYRALWHTPIGIRIGAFEFGRSLEWIVNDGLMVIFFFVVGLEIRREIHQGELSEWRRAALPLVAAVGGMIAPAMLYMSTAGGRETHSGWGVPMATDIAFAIGVLTLLGRRVQPALRVLLLALAVIDDLGAILVIALFYSAGVSLGPLAVAAAAFVIILALRGLGVRNKLAYFAPALVVWAGVYGSGVHPAIAGVAIGFITPVRAWLGPTGFVKRVRAPIDSLTEREPNPPSTHDVSVALDRVSRMRREALSPAESLIHQLHPWVAFGIMPVFALANAGVKVDAVSLEGSALHVALGVTVGLVVGKPVGVLIASAVAVRLRLASLPASIGHRELLVLGCVAGVGFTMALFVAQLAFLEPKLLAAAKLGVLAASACAGCAALAFGRALLPNRPREGAAFSEAEAECSTAK